MCNNQQEKQFSTNRRQKKNSYIRHLLKDLRKIRWKLWGSKKVVLKLSVEFYVLLLWTLKISQVSKIDLCCLNEDLWFNEWSSRSWWVIVMFLLPPKLTVDKSLFSKFVGFRFLIHKDRNLAAVSPNSAVFVIVASSNRT